MGEGPRDNAACARRHDLSLWQLQANELADEQAKKGFALHPSVAQVEQSYSARASCLGWLAKFLGRLHAYMKFRGRRDVAPRVQRQLRMLPGRLVVFQRKPRKKRATHAKFSGTHTLAKTGSCWFCWKCGFYTAVKSLGGVLKKFKDGRNPQDGRWLAEPTWRAVARADVVQVAATETGWSWRDVVDELEHDDLGVDQFQVRHESYVSL